MTFRQPKKQPQFMDLKGILAQSRDTDNALYQTVQILIERLSQFQSITVEDVKGNTSGLNTVVGTVGTLVDATYLTTDDETAVLGSSVQLLAGTGITFDDTTPNQRTISSSGGGGSFVPVSTGAEPLEIMSNGAGSVLLVGFSE